MKHALWLSTYALFALAACQSGEYKLSEDAPPSSVANAQFAAPREVALPAQSAQMQRADWDDDGQLDLLVPVPRIEADSSTTEDGRVFAFAINPNQTNFLTLQKVWEPTVPAWHQSVVVADVNQDNQSDLVLTRTDTNAITWLDSPSWNDDNRSLVVGDTPISLISGDWNQDNQTDLAVTNRFSDTISVLQNQGSGNFTLSQTISTRDYPQQLISGDWNRDGQIDLAALALGENQLQLWTGNGQGSFALFAELDTPSTPQQLSAGDWDCDGRVDLAVTSRIDEVLRLWYGDGSGNFSGPVDIAAGRGPTSFAVADFNEDGVQDFVLSNQYLVALTSVTTLTGELSLVLSTGTTAQDASAYASSELFAATLAPQGDTPGTLLVEDFDNNGQLDLLVTLPLQQKIALLEGKQFSGALSCP
jgi:hypothetical protein